MGKIESLSQARKSRDKAADKAKAAENRAKFGRTGAEKAAVRSAAERLEREIDGHRRSPAAPTNSPDQQEHE